MELLALIFVIVAIAIPAYLQTVQAPDPEQLTLMERARMDQRTNVATWQEVRWFFWGLTVVGLYVIHLLIAGASLDFLSTPFTYLFAPLIFSMITYYRLYQISHEAKGTAHVVSGSLLEIIAWIVGVMVITLLVARIRMARHMMKFRDVRWDVVQSSPFDGTFLELCAHFQPLVYPPRRYRLCDEGILIEGWFYVMPLSFESIQAMDAARSASSMTAGEFLATSAHNLVRMRIIDQVDPLYISPADPATFLSYCEPRIAARHAAAMSDTAGRKTTAHTPRH